jgi:hypothetical protein
MGLSWGSGQQLLDRGEALVGSGAADQLCWMLFTPFALRQDVKVSARGVIRLIDPVYLASLALNFIASPFPPLASSGAPPPT